MSDSSRPDSEFEPERVVIRDNRKIDRETDAATGGEQSPPAAGAAPAHTPPHTDEDDVPKAEALLLEERTRDLQRLQAEYANYRKRADRERLAAGEVAVGRTLAELLPIVDDLDRARAHGDLTGALKAVADKLDAAFTKLGLVAFGEAGDPFDPSIHEAVTHDEGDHVQVPTATMVMRQGYKHNERLLRPAMVGVTDPLTPVAVAGGAEAQGDRATEHNPAGTPANQKEDDGANQPPDETN